MSPPSTPSSFRTFAESLSKAGVAFWICSLATAAAEGTIGWWLRHLPLGDRIATSVLAAWLGLLFVLLALRVASSWGRDQAQEAASIRAGDRFVREVWRLDGRSDVATWLTREGREAIEQGARSALVLASSGLSLLVLLPLMVWLSPILSCALLVLAPLLGWVGKRRWRAAREWANEEHVLLSRHALDESWSWRAAPESRGSGTGRILSRLRRAASVELTRSRLRGARLTTRGQASTEAAAHVAGWILASLALFGWSCGLLAAPDLLAFLAAALLAYRPIREAGRALPAWHRHHSVLERTREHASAGALVSIPEARALAVRNLRVTAPDGPVLVDGPTFELHPGESFLLSGANGSGKTSLLAGLLGWREASGILARPGRMRALAQEPVLPPFTPRQWSGVDAPESLPLFPFLFPHGLPCPWDAPLHEGGTRLSRGERARMALLCLTATPADLWLFDEPFSALPIAERASLLAALRSIQGDAALLFSDPLSLDPADAPVVWEAAPGQKGPRIYRL